MGVGRRFGEIACGLVTWRRFNHVSRRRPVVRTSRLIVRALASVVVVIIL